jgi:hypothetical protein
MNPGWHVLDWSQHPWQFAALHVGTPATHAWAVQVLLEAPQLVQTPPPLPQNESRLPGKQSVPSQHPVGQVAALHTGGGSLTHAPPPNPPSNPPPLHVSFSEVQSAHSWPFVPQAPESLP